MKRIFYIVTFFFLLICNPVWAQKWEAPSDAISIVNPVANTPENLSKGKELYAVNCKSCHGDPGQHNGLTLPPVNPPDLASEDVQANTEGALFYFISTGRVTMPSFKAIIPEDDRWKLAMFIKSLGSQTETVAVAQSVRLQGKAVLTVEIKDEEEKIYASLNDVVDSVSTPIPNVRIDFFVKRYFGNLKVNSATTGSNGSVVIAFPEDIAGDSTGCVTLVVKSDPEACTAETLVENSPICSIHYAKNIFEKRVMWSENDKTQWWVILSYLGVVAGVWLTILYVVMLIGKIRKLGNA